jgi:hypothetical protein
MKNKPYPALLQTSYLSKEIKKWYQNLVSYPFKKIILNTTCSVHISVCRTEFRAMSYRKIYFRILNIRSFMTS